MKHLDIILELQIISLQSMHNEYGKEIPFSLLQWEIWTVSGKSIEIPRLSLLFKHTLNQTNTTMPKNF